MFVHQTLVGDGTLMARVTRFRERTHRRHLARATASAVISSQSNSQLHPGMAPWAKAGIILERDTNQGTGLCGRDGHRLSRCPDAVQLYARQAGLVGAVGPSSPGGFGSPESETSSAATTRSTAFIGPRSARPGSRAFPTRSRSGCSPPPRCTSLPGPATGHPAWLRPTLTVSPLEATFPSAPGPETRSPMSLLAVGPHLATGIRRFVHHQRVRRHRTARGWRRCRNPLVRRQHRQRNHRRAPHRDRARCLIRHYRVPPRAHPHHPRRQPTPRPGPRRQSGRRRIDGLRRRSRRNRDRRSDHPPRLRRQRELSLSAKRGRPGAGHHRHGTIPWPRRGTGRGPRHDAAAQRRGGRRRPRAPRAARHSRHRWLQHLADALHPDRGLRHPSHPAPLRPSHQRLHVSNGYFPISPWAGLAVLAAYIAVAMGAATWLLRRRDA